MKSINDHIELRSEKVRQLVGQRPPVFIRWGTYIIVITFILLILIVVFSPFPHGNGETIFSHLFEMKDKL
jgi:hypothetical protein